METTGVYTNWNGQLQVRIGRWSNGQWFVKPLFDQLQVYKEMKIFATEQEAKEEIAMWNWRRV